MDALLTWDRGHGGWASVEDEMPWRDRDPRCRACAERIDASQPITVQGGRPWHVACWLDAVTTVV